MLVGIMLVEFPSINGNSFLSYAKNKTKVGFVEEVLVSRKNARFP